MFDLKDKFELFLFGYWSVWENFLIWLDIMGVPFVPEHFKGSLPEDLFFCLGYNT